MRMSASHEVTRSTSKIAHAEGKDPPHGTPLVIATSASQAPVSKRAQQRRLCHHQSLSVVNLHAVYKVGNADVTRKSFDSAQLSATPKQVTIRRHSDSYTCRRLARSSFRPPSPPNSQSRREICEVKVMPLSSRATTRIGTGDDDLSDMCKGWKDVEQERPRFRLEPLASRKSCQDARNLGSKCAGSRNSNSEPDTPVTQFPRLCDPAAKALSKSVRDFSKLGHPGTFVH